MHRLHAIERHMQPDLSASPFTAAAAHPNAAGQTSDTSLTPQAASSSINIPLTSAYAIIPQLEEQLASAAPNPPPPAAVSQKSMTLAQWKSTAPSTFLGYSSWRCLSQLHLDCFSALTGDHQFIHQQDAAARGSPFPSSIAHGFLVLSLTTAMVMELMPALTGVRMGVNYGMEKVRWMQPVLVGQRFRAAVTVLEVETVKGAAGAGRGVQARLLVEMKLEGHEDKPAMVATWLVRQYAESTSTINTGSV
jgi:acyl dehydratase